VHLAVSGLGRLPVWGVTPTKSNIKQNHNHHTQHSSKPNRHTYTTNEIQQQQQQ